MKLLNPTNEWDNYLYDCIMFPYNTPYFIASPFASQWYVDHQSQSNSNDNYIVNTICNIPFNAVASFIRIGISGGYFTKINKENYEDVMKREKEDYPSINLCIYDRYLCADPCTFTFTIHSNRAGYVTYKFELIPNGIEFGNPGPYQMKLSRIQFNIFDINYLLTIWLLDLPYIAFIGS